jgi:hypothetical protein
VADGPAPAAVIGLEALQRPEPSGGVLAEHRIGHLCLGHETVEHADTQDTPPP